MKGIIIAGTSGVGKTHLESELNNQANFQQLTKLTDRESRPGEDPKVTRSVSPDEFQKLHKSGELLFYLHYNGKNYGWLKQDAEKYNDKILTMGITLESLERAVVDLPHFLPVLLKVAEQNFDLIRQRMSEREKSEEEVEKRIELARQELEGFEKHEELVAKHGGKTFEVLDDTTLYEQVIPWIKEELGVS